MIFHHFRYFFLNHIHVLTPLDGWTSRTIFFLSFIRTSPILSVILFLCEEYYIILLEFCYSLTRGNWMIVHCQNPPPQQGEFHLTQGLNNNSSLTSSHLVSSFTCLVFYQEAGSILPVHVSVLPFIPKHH